MANSVSANRSSISRRVRAIPAVDEHKFFEMNQWELTFLSFRIHIVHAGDILLSVRLSLLNVLGPYRNQSGWTGLCQGSKVF